MFKVLKIWNESLIKQRGKEFRIALILFSHDRTVEIDIKEIIPMIPAKDDQKIETIEDN